MNNKISGTLLHEWNNQTQSDIKSFSDYDSYFSSSKDTTIAKLECFPKYVRRQSLSKFLARAEIFKKILDIHGSVIDCGINSGTSLFTFAQLSSIFEPVNYTRKVIGFDTFSGLKGVSEKDSGSNASEHIREGGFNSGSEMFEDIAIAARLYDSNRQLGHINKIEVIKGDARETIPKYISENKHLVVSLLHLDMDIYEPTMVALEYIVPRMPKGSIIIFDELNQPSYPGETLAVDKVLKIRNLKINRIVFETGISFALLE